jgi:hypothetical protein
MQACQHCGAKSWGAVADPAPGAAEMLKCDGCESIGLKSVIDIPTTLEEIAANKNYGVVFPHLPAQAADPMVLAMQNLRSLMPAPETRLERLTKAIIAGPYEIVSKEGETVGTEELSRRIVRLASFLEVELEREELLNHAPPSSPDADFPRG